MKRKTLLLGLLLVAIAMLALAGTALASAPAPAPVCTDRNLQGGPEEQPTVDAKLFFPRMMSPCGNPVVKEVPYQDNWANSPHNDVTAEAFNHWNAQGNVPVDCAKCHSTPGYQDYLGADGSTPEKVDVPAVIGTTVYCVACHNTKADTLTSVVFPSGVRVTGLGNEARCMVCHQGVLSGPQLQTYIDSKNLGSSDTVSPTLTFQNQHYFAAAATMYGSEVHGGYEYSGMAYDVRFQHVEGYQACFQCHDQHTLKIRYTECVKCHAGATDEAGLRDIRMQGSEADYDGDGNVTEGMYYELDGLRSMLYTAIQSYATQVSGKGIVYDAATYPYWFIDTNGNGVVDPGENVNANKYNAFTARLLEATYNYQASVKDPGAFAHGGKYVVQLMHDSTADLNTKISPQVDLSEAARLDPGHFASSQVTWRDWDAAPPAVPLDGETPQACGRCHSAAGLPLIVHNTGTNGLPPVTVSGGNSYALSIMEPVTSALMCSTCHKNVGGDWARLPVPKVQFPSGAAVTFPDANNKDANICMTCHQGRESTVSVDTSLAGKPLDTPDAALGFKNVHYFAAGATLWGNDVKGMYQYTGNTYLGRNLHGPGIATYDACTECHDVHELKPKADKCATCHLGVTEETLRDIRGAFGGNTGSNVDYDGDGNKTEGINYEIDTMETKLYAAIQLYAQDISGTKIAYSAAAYPYWFIDTNGNGVADPDEAVRTNGYNKWTPRLLKAAYNYQYVQKDPGQFAHNSKYVLQGLYDGLQDLGTKVTVDMTGMVRP